MGILVEVNDDGDYELLGNSCWIQVGNVSIYIHRDELQVCVDLCPVGLEASQTLDSAGAIFSEVKEIIAENEADEFIPY